MIEKYSFKEVKRIFKLIEQGFFADINKGVIEQDESIVMQKLAFMLFYFKEYITHHPNVKFDCSVDYMGRDDCFNATMKYGDFGSDVYIPTFTQKISKGGVVEGRRGGINEVELLLDNDFNVEVFKSIRFFVSELNENIALSKRTAFKDVVTKGTNFNNCLIMVTTRLDANSHDVLHLSRDKETSEYMDRLEKVILSYLERVNIISNIKKTSNPPLVKKI